MNFVPLLITVAAIAVGTVALCLLGRGGGWAVVVAITIAVLAADRPLLGEGPQWRPSDLNWRDPLQRVIVATIPMAAAALAVSARLVPWWGRAIVATVAPAAVLFWIRSAYPGSPWDQWVPQLLLPAAASLAVWASLSALAVRRPRGVAVPWTLGCLTGGLGLLTLWSVYTAPGWVTVAVGVVLAAACGMSVIGRGPAMSRGPVTLAVPLLVCLVAVSQIGGGEVPPKTWGVLAAAAAAAWLGELIPGRAWVRETIRAVIVATVVAAAVVPGYRRFAAERAAEAAGPGW